MYNRAFPSEKNVPISLQSPHFWLSKRRPQKSDFNVYIASFSVALGSLLVANGLEIIAIVFEKKFAVMFSDWGSA